MSKELRQYKTLMKIADAIIADGGNPSNEPTRAIFRKCNALWKRLSEAERAAIYAEENIYLW